VKALITGIAGFTGRYLAEALSRRGIGVVGISQSVTAVPFVDRLHAADVSKLDDLRDVVQTEQPDYVVHLAAISNVVHGDVEEIYRTNVVGTRNLLGALAELDKRPEAVLVASSSNVYGNRHEGLLKEAMQPDPVNDYSVSKVAAEMVAGLFRQQLPVIVARPFNYTGLGQSRDFLIPKIIGEVRARAPSIRLGNLDVARDFSDVRFVCEAYCRLLQCPAAIGRIINVSSGRAYQLREVMEMITNIVGYEPRVEVDPALVRKNEVKQLWGDSSQLDTLVGPVERIDLIETLRWMIAAEG
jgi:nucleoside-diphosphate-sugar epimerase